MAEKKEDTKKKGVVTPGLLRSLNKQIQQGGGILLPKNQKPEVIPSSSEDLKEQDDKATDSQWQDFLSYAQEYKETKGPCIQVWLDADVNYTLDAIRQAGVKIPVKHLLSAAVRVFLESHANEIHALMDKKPKMII